MSERPVTQDFAYNPRKPQNMAYPTDVKESVEAQPLIHSFHERTTGTWQYIVADPITHHAVVIDPVMDAAKGLDKQAMSTSAADELLLVVAQRQYIVDRVLETRAPSEHRSAAWFVRTQIQQHTGNAPRVSSGKSFAGVQRMFARKYGISDAGWGGAFDGEFADGQVFQVGSLKVHIMKLPARSQDHLGFMIGRNVFLGDPVLTAEHDVGKMDFEDEQAHQLSISMQRLLSLPKDFRIYASQSGKSALEASRPSATIEEVRSRCNLMAGH